MPFDHLPSHASCQRRCWVVVRPGHLMQNYLLFPREQRATVYTMLTFDFLLILAVDVEIADILFPTSL